MIRRAHRPQRGVILAAALVMIGLLALSMAGFIFFVRAETAGITAYSRGQDVRLAAESGFEELVSILRQDQHNPQNWYNNPDRLRHALVWAQEYDRESDPVRESGSRIDAFGGKQSDSIAYRYAVIAPWWDGPDRTFRYGMTPEAAKLNINYATDAQIYQLMAPLMAELAIENPAERVAAILDWRDSDDDTRPGGAEVDYYNTLEPPYNTKNAPFDTVEELLLVKGITAAVLWGEDTNRNGILDENEDDGEASFPYYDNGDGILNPGIAPFLTVSSREPDTTLKNQPRISLGQQSGTVPLQVAQYYPDGELSEATIAFLTSLPGVDRNKLSSPADLYSPGDEDEDSFLTSDASDAEPNAADSNDAAAGGAPNDPNAIAALEIPVPDGRPAVDSSPITLEELPYLMDGFTTRQGAREGQPAVVAGLVNINAASRRVLLIVPGMTPDVADAIIAGRQSIDGEQRKTTAWLLTEGLISPAAYRRIAPYITAKAYQFHVEILGYADHLPMMRRFEWLVEMIGPIPQVLYYRDLTPLGFAWPIDDDTVVVTGGS